MAKKSGTATDYLDLMQKLRDFMSGVGSPASGLNWQVMRDTSVNSPVPSQYEMIFRGTGGTSPEQDIYWGLKSYFDAPSALYNWEIAGFTGFVDGSPEGSVAFEDQPGVIGLANVRAYVPLQNTSMDFWFWGNERRVIMVVKTGTAYQFMYAGFLNIFGTDVEYPYPLMFMGSSWNVDQKFNDNDLDYATAAHPGGDSSNMTSAATSRKAVGWIWWIDGQWWTVKNFYNSGGTEGQLNVPTNNVLVWPMGQSADTHIPSSDQYSVLKYPFALFKGTSAGGTPVARLSATPASPSAIPQLFPLTLYSQGATNLNFVGEMDNVYWVPGTSGVTAEDTLTDNGVSPEETFIIFQNVHRTDDWMYFAVKDE